MAQSREGAAVDTGALSILPVIVGMALAALFVAGLLLGGRAEDDFTYFAGLAFAGFSLFLGWRYFDRYLP
jgi:hypothetical protein